MTLSVADEVAAAAFAGWEPTRPPLTHRQFALRTKLPGGPLKGAPFDPSTDPAQNYLVDQLDSGQWERVFWAAPPQIAGKTQLAVIVPSLRAVVELRAAVGYGLPTLHDLDRGWTTKIAPTIKEAGFAAYLPRIGPGSKGGRPPVVTFEHPETRAPLGSFVFLAGGARQVTCRVIVIDEIDAWRDAGGTARWADLEDVWARADSFQAQAIRIGTGTVETDDPDQSIILACVQNLGTGTRLWARCRHCGEHAPMEFTGFSWDYRIVDGDQPGPDLEHAKATAAYACPRCATVWSEDDRQAALRGAAFAHKGQAVDASGKVTGPPPQTKSFGLRTHALDCVMTTMAAIAEKECAARYARDSHGNHEPMRKFWRYQRVEHYTADRSVDDDGATIIPTRNRLAALSASSPYVLAVDRREEDGDSIHLAEIPEWCEHTTVGVDVQRGGERAPGRLIFAALSRGAGRGAVTAWGSIVAAPKGRQPTETELHAALDRLDGLLRDWAPAAAIVRRGLDVGDQQDELVRWLRTHRDWLAIKGTGPLKATDRRDRAGWLYVRDQEGWTLRLMETQSVTRIIHGELLARDRDKPGSLLLPKGLERNSAIVQHLCATVEYAPGKWSEKPQHRVHHPEWQLRHDYLDAAAMARALAYDWEQRPARPTVRKYGAVGSIGV